MWFRCHVNTSDGSSGTTGWIAGGSAPNTTSNSLYKEAVLFTVTNGQLTQAATQRAASVFANPPGFAQPGGYVDASSKLTDSYEVG